MVRKEIIDPLKKMKGGKAVTMDGFVIRVLKNRGINIMDCLLEIFDRCMEIGQPSNLQRTGK